SSQIVDSEDETTDENSESLKVNKQSSEIQEDDDYQEQSDDSLLPEENSKPLHVNKPPLPPYSTNIESLDNYFKEWAVQYNQLKCTKAEVEEKMLKLLYELRGAYLTLLIILAEVYERDKKKPPSPKILRGLVKGKVKSILKIGERHEQRYWVGTWRFIELLNITHCRHLKYKYNPILSCNHLITI
ncbi:36464_t:CDS:2, partial [Gigaspora margarita]